MNFFSWILRISMVLFFSLILILVPVQAQNGTNESRIKASLKETWQNNSWLNESKSEYYYDVSGQQSTIIYMRWKSDSWKDTTVVTNYYNAQGLLEEREEKQLSTEFVLSHELYEYDENGNLTGISFPDTPWFRARGIFDVYQIPFTDIMFINPYLLTSHILGIQYEYNSSGLLNRINYMSMADAIQDSIFDQPKLHPLNTQTYLTSEYSGAVLNAYRDSLWSINPVDAREIMRSQEITYQTNGVQIAALSHHDPFNAGRVIDMQWDFYDIWHPGEVRTLWFYSNDEQANSANQFSSNQFMVSHFNPNKRHPFFSDLMAFWLSDESDPALYNVSVNATSIVTRYFTSKLQQSLSFSNNYIPGNYYQYFYEPRFRTSYPIKNKRMLKSVEQVLLPLQKLSSPIHYGFNWDYNFQWIDSIQRNYEYDESGRLLRSIINTWEWDKSGALNPENGWWEKDSKYEFFYDETGNGSMILLYVWNNDSKNWDNKERISFTYEDITISENQKSNRFDIKLSNHPNPFNSKTVITFRIEDPSVTSLKIYDLTGRLVRTIISSQKLSAAEHSYSWDGKDKQGRTVSSGLYLYRVATENLRKAGRCLFLK